MQILGNKLDLFTKRTKGAGEPVNNKSKLWKKQNKAMAVAKREAKT